MIAICCPSKVDLFSWKRGTSDFAPSTKRSHFLKSGADQWNQHSSRKKCFMDHPWDEISGRKTLNREKSMSADRN